MIPKTVHYIWLGGNKKPGNFHVCKESWDKYLRAEDGWKIKEWTEENLPMSQFPEYFHKALREKKWAFASDVARTHILLSEGGIYLDTDILLYKSLDSVLDYEFFAGHETPDSINGAIFGSTKNNFIIKEMIEYYENNLEIKAIPVIMTSILGRLKSEGKLNQDIYIAPVDVFYSYPMNRPMDPLKWKAPKEALAIHLWDYSWQSDTKKTLRKIPGFTTVKNILKNIGLLEFVKKLLKQI
jgi:mannosyltransferase OCH1-like enzyme